MELVAQQGAGTGAGSDCGGAAPHVLHGSTDNSSTEEEDEDEVPCSIEATHELAQRITLSAKVKRLLEWLPPVLQGPTCRFCDPATGRLRECIRNVGTHNHRRTVSAATTTALRSVFRRKACRGHAHNWFLTAICCRTHLQVETPFLVVLLVIHRLHALEHLSFVMPGAASPIQRAPTLAEVMSATSSARTMDDVHKFFASCCSDDWPELPQVLCHVASTWTLFCRGFHGQGEMRSTTTRWRPATRVRPRLPRGPNACTLLVEDSKDAICLTTVPFTIGSGKDGKITSVVIDRQIAPQHVRIGRDDKAGWWLRTLHRDGAIVDGAVLLRSGREVPLQSGSLIHLGNTEVRVWFRKLPGAKGQHATPALQHAAEATAPAILRLAGVAASLQATSPPVFYDLAELVAHPVWLEKLRKSVLRGTAHGPSASRLGLFYSSTELCCHRCRTMFKTSQQGCRRPKSDVRFWEKSLRIQACYDAGMRLHPKPCSGNQHNHGAGLTMPTTSEHVCAVAVFLVARVNEALRQALCLPEDFLLMPTA